MNGNDVQSSSVPPIDTDEWVDRYGDMMFRYAYYRVNDRALAEDLVQEAFLSALKSVSGFAGRSSVQTWLMGILKHKVIDYYRKNLSTLAQQIDTVDDVDSSFTRNGMWRQQIDNWSDLPDSLMVRKEFFRTLNECLSYLPEAQRSVFVLREVNGLETDEICKDCGVSSTNIWVLLHRARKKLRDCLNTNWFRKDKK